jgi:hypothetical protein
LKLDSEGKPYGKVVLITATLLVWLFILISFKYYGYEKTWQLWNVPTEMPPFLDFRLIPGSAESFLRGFEPTVENPYDPRSRIFNYPAFWRIFFYTGITQDDTVWIGVLMIVLFFLGVFLFPDKLKIPAAIAMLFVVFSPAAMLLYERGNADLIVFVICVLIVLASEYSANLAALVLMFGAVVKLFPFFGVSVLLRESKSKFLWLFGGCFLFLLTYMLLTLDSVKASWNLTMRGDGLSYGTNILVTRYGASMTRILAQWFSGSIISPLLKYGPLAMALFLIFIVFIFAVRTQSVPEISSERNLTAFRMGASIYVGTFLLGNNWDYRLAFLVLVVPQLMYWLGSGDKQYRLLAGLGMGTVLMSCWYLIISSHLDFFEHSAKFWLIFDEGVNWLLFAVLAYLLFASVPNWVKTQFQISLPKKISAS